MSSILTSRREIVERIQALAPQLRAVGITRLSLFGSFQTGTQRADSDVDLLVEFAPGLKTFDNFTTACNLLEDSLGRPVELVTIESLSPYIGPHILREAEDVIVAA